MTDNSSASETQRSSDLRHRIAHAILAAEAGDPYETDHFKLADAVLAVVQPIIDHLLFEAMTENETLRVTQARLAAARTTIGNAYEFLMCDQELLARNKLADALDEVTT